VQILREQQKFLFRAIGHLTVQAKQFVVTVGLAWRSG
jgi:hypothetical protein